MYKLSFAGIAAIVATIAALALGGVASGAIGLDSGITPSSGTQGTTFIQKGKCTGTSTSWLEVSKVNSYIQVKFVVQAAQVPTLQPTPRKSWSVTLVRNNALVFNGIVSPESTGRLTVTRYFAPSITPTQIVAAAKTLDSSESCTATTSF
jgi:hypothetical protein